VSVATAALPNLSRQFTEGDTPGMRHTLSSALRLMLMMNVPAMVGLMVLASPIVELVFEYKKFSDDDTRATAQALMFYAPGLLGYSAVKIISPAFYAMKDSRTPVAVSLGSVGVNIVLNLMLVRVLGYRGLALGTAIAALMNAGLLLWIFRGRVHGIEGRELFTSSLKILVASLVMGVVAYASFGWLLAMLPGDTALLRGVRVFGAIGLAVVALAGSAQLLHIEEFKDAAARVLKRVRR
jgi:putative peptidoglycan lipid II flippase